MEMLDQYTKEDDIKQQLKSAKEAREAAVLEIMDAGCE